MKEYLNAGSSAIYKPVSVKTQTADYRSGVKCRLRVKGRLQTSDQG